MIDMGGCFVDYLVGRIGVVIEGVVIIKVVVIVDLIVDLAISGASRGITSARRAHGLLTVAATARAAPALARHWSWSRTFWKVCVSRWRRVHRIRRCGARSGGRDVDADVGFRVVHG